MDRRNGGRTSLVGLRRGAGGLGIALAVLLPDACSVDYRADDAAYRCAKNGICPDAGAPDASSGGDGSGGHSGGRASGGGPDHDGGAGDGVGGGGAGGRSDGHGGAGGSGAGGVVAGGQGGVAAGGADNAGGAVACGPGDIDEGAPLGGSVELFRNEAGRASIVWSEAAGSYAVAWTDRSTGNDHLHLTLLDAHGEEVAGADADLTRPGDNDQASDIVVVPGGGGADVEYRILSVAKKNETTFELYFRRAVYEVTDGGAKRIHAFPRQFVSEVQGYTRPALFGADFGSVAGWFDFDVDFQATLATQGIGLDGSLPGPAIRIPLQAFAQAHVAVANVGTTVAIGWVQCAPSVDAGDAGAGCKVRALLIDASTDAFSVITELEIGDTGASPVIVSFAANATTFMAAWTENDPSGQWALGYATFGVDGLTHCASKRYLSRAGVDLETTLGGREAPALTAMPDGSFLALVDYRADKLFFAKLNTECIATEGVPLVAAPGPAFMYEPRIATSGQSVVALWHQAFGDASTLRVRKLSPFLCAAP